MKIKSINIASFGGLKNKSCKFSDGFNVIYGDNENGKTTVMTFIKMMFYGNEKGSSAIAKNPRKKYTPWDGSLMAGSIDFEYKGKNYRLEREFRATNSTDKLTLCDLDLGDRQSVSGDIGTKFFGMSAAAFERSVFIGQFGGFEKDSSAEGEINAKLSNIVTTGDESISYNVVNSRLDKAKLALISKNGKAGEYNKNIGLIEKNREKLQLADKSQLQLQSVKIEIERLKNEIEALQKTADGLKATINIEKDIRNASKLKEMLNCKQQLDTLNETLKLSDGKLIDEMFIRKVTFCISKIDGLKQKMNLQIAESQSLIQSIELATSPNTDISEEKAEKLRTEIKGLESKLNSLLAQISKLENQYNSELKNESSAQKCKKAFNPLLLISAIIILSVAAALFLTKIIIAGTSLSGIGIICLILSFVLRPEDRERIMRNQAIMLQLKNNITELQSKKNDVSNNISYLSAQLDTIQAVLNSNNAMTENQKKRLSECKEQIKLLTEEIDGDTKNLLSLFGRYMPINSLEEIEGELKNISKKSDMQKEIKRQLNYILKDVGNISYEQAREKLTQIGEHSAEISTDFDRLKQKYETIITAISDKKANLATLVAEAKTYLEKSENPEAIKLTIKELEEKNASQKEFYNAADLAMQVLTESFVELRRSYGSVLEQKSGEIFAGITDGAYKYMGISKSFDINVEKNGVFGGKSLDYLSSGTTDQAYLSLRLALASLISETSGESLPILLDDALTQYDDSRVKIALEFLKKYSEKEQIIMFTCHNSIYESAKFVKADCKNLL